MAVGGFVSAERLMHQVDHVFGQHLDFVAHDVVGFFEFLEQHAYFVAVGV